MVCLGQRLDVVDMLIVGSAGGNVYSQKTQTKSVPDLTFQCVVIPFFPAFYSSGPLQDLSDYKRT